MGQALRESLNGMFGRAAANANDEKASLALRIERSLDDSTCDPSLFSRVAEAVIEGRMEREDLNGILGHIAKKRAAGEIRVSTGALFNHLIKRRLGANYKGGGK